MEDDAKVVDHVEGVDVNDQETVNDQECHNSVLISDSLVPSPIAPKVKYDSSDDDERRPPSPAPYFVKDIIVYSDVMDEVIEGPIGVGGPIGGLDVEEEIQPQSDEDL